VGWVNNFFQATWSVEIKKCNRLIIREIMKFCLCACNQSHGQPILAILRKLSTVKQLDDSASIALFCTEVDMTRRYLNQWVQSRSEPTYDLTFALYEHTEGYDRSVQCQMLYTGQPAVPPGSCRLGRAMGGGSRYQQLFYPNRFSSTNHPHFSRMPKQKRA
jgi:hypothetical protein